MKKIKLSIIIISVITLLFSLISCNGDSEGGKSSAYKTITLNVYNWGEYISDGSLGSLDTNAAFEDYFNENLADEYGYNVEVNYTTYATNEDMYSKITSGAGTYDVIVPSDYMIEKLKNEGWLYKFDAASIENYKYIDSEFKNLPYDENNEYSVPYTYGMMGIIYNAALVDEEDYSGESWGLLWNEKYKGKILQFNNPRDAFGSAMYYTGLDVNSTDPDVWEAALAKLVEQKPLIQAYVNDEIYNKMTTASAAVAPYFAGDFLTMAYQNEDLSFYYPAEGTNYFVDAMCIPKNARYPEIAMEYINFMLSEEAAIANALYIGYASPNTLVRSSEEYQEGIMELHPDAMDILYGKSLEEANANYPYSPIYRSFTEDIQTQVNSLWESLKTENSTELWVHITCGVIVVSVLTLAIYTTYVKKKRSRDYRLRDKEAAKLRKMQS